LRTTREGATLPTYEYKCESCGNRYEKREGFEAKARQKCPKCGKMAQRMLSTPAVVFKGSGFYKTDSRGTSSASADSEPGTTSTPAAPAADGPGHSHGPGGHTHDTPAKAPATPSTSTDTPTETAAAT
jgi:putative FmdB family regulatory protein